MLPMPKRQAEENKPSRLPFGRQPKPVNEVPIPQGVPIQRIPPPTMQLLQEQYQEPKPLPVPQQDISQDEIETTGKLIKFKQIIRRLNLVEQQLKSGRVVEKSEQRVGGAKDVFELISEAEELQFIVYQIREDLKRYYTDQQLDLFEQEALDGIKSYSYYTLK